MFPQLKIEVINLLIISALYSKDMSLFKAHADSKGEVSWADKQWGTGKPAWTAAQTAEKSQLAEETFFLDKIDFSANLS